MNQSFMFSGNVSKKRSNSKTCFNVSKLVKQFRPVNHFVNKRLNCVHDTKKCLSHS